MEQLWWQTQVQVSFFSSSDFLPPLIGLNQQATKLTSVDQTNITNHPYILAQIYVILTKLISQRKKWAGHDLKHMKHHDLKEARGKAIKTANWKAKQVKEQMKRAKKFKAAKKEASKSLSTKGGKKGRKKYKT